MLTCLVQLERCSDKRNFVISDSWNILLLRFSVLKTRTSQASVYKLVMVHVQGQWLWEYNDVSHTPAAHSDSHVLG